MISVLPATALWLAGCAAAPEVEKSPAYTVEWAAPSECPGVETLHETVATMLDPEATTPAVPLSVRGKVTGSDETGWRLELELGRGGSAQQRTIGADRCQALVESTAFIIAVALDPNFGAAEEEPVEPPAPKPEPEPEPPEPEPVRTPTWIYGSLGGGVRRGAWPTGAAVEATVGFAGAAWRVELSGAFDVPQRIAAASPDDDISMQVQVARGVLRGCAYKRVERVAFPVCGVLELGSIDARGRGLTTTRREQRLWAAAGLRGAMEVTLGGPVALGLHVDGMVPFIEHRFVADPEPVTEIYRSGAAEFRAGGYLRVRFGAVGASDRRKSGSRGS